MQRGGLLEREHIVPLQTGIILEGTGYEQKINDGGAIVPIKIPIENPELNGQLGFLLARHVVIGPRKSHLTQVHHVRVDYANDKSPALTDYDRVTLARRGPSRQPYGICTITPSQYARFLLDLTQGGNGGMERIYQFMHSNIADSSLVQGKLFLPKGYAMR